MEIERFQSNDLLKKIYINMKALKDLLGVDIKSYSIKKVVLRPGFVASTMEPKADLDELLLEAMSHSDMKRGFQDRVDYHLWKREIVERKEKAKGNFGKVPLVHK
jgi:hypothetical protein